MLHFQLLIGYSGAMAGVWLHLHSNNGHTCHIYYCLTELCLHLPKIANQWTT